MPADPTTTPRARMVVELSASLAKAVAVGDIEAARVAHEALGKLLGSSNTSADEAEVVDLASHRKAKRPPADRR